MSRRIATAVGLGLLALTALVVVALALRSPTPPPAATPRLALGAITVVDGTTWRWVGPAECTPKTDAIPLERRGSRGPWRSSPVPLVTVEVLAFANASTGVAIGETTECARGVAVTTDGGVTWSAAPENPVLLDAWWADDRLWAVVQGEDAPDLQALTVTTDATLTPVPEVRSSKPCDTRDGVASQVAFYGLEDGLLLCEQPTTDGRLLARTTTAGTTFERLTDDRPETGLNGAGPVVDLDVVDPSWAWTQFPRDEECAEGQFRRSDTQGQVWERLPCPSQSTLIDVVLDAAFTSKRDGVLLGVLANEPLLLTTDDGGQSWTPTR